MIVASLLKLTSVLSSLALMCLLSISTHGLTISLDPTFGEGGKVRIGFSPSGNENANSFYVVSRGSGETVLFGGYSADADSGFAWLGLGENGQLNKAFGTGGTALEIGNPDNPESFLDMQELPDGRFLRLGMFFQTNVPTLKLFNANGSRDLSFNANLILDPAHTNFPRKFTVRPDGRITILVYDQTAVTYYLVRLNTDGSRDTTFGPVGIREVNLKRLLFPGNVSAMHALSDGRIIVGGYTPQPPMGGGGPNPHVHTAWVAVLDEHGYFDRRFGRQGIARIFVGAGGRVHDMVVDAGGKILLAGTGPSSSTEGQTMLIRFTPRGRLDTSFGNGGIVLTRVNPVSGSQDSPAAATLTPSGEIVVAGSTEDVPFGMSKFMVARFSPSGTLIDQTNTQFLNGRYAVGTRVSCQTDRKIVVAGYTQNLSGAGNAGAARRGDLVISKGDQDQT